MQNRELGESPAHKTVRLSMEAKISDYHKAGDSTQVNALLDVYPDGKERPELSREQLIESLHDPMVARFFRPVVIEGLLELPNAA